MHGGQPHDLARKIGVGQSLAYRYFPTKEVLADRVFETGYLARWNPECEALLADRSLPIEELLKRYYVDDVKVVLHND